MPHSDEVSPAAHGFPHLDTVRASIAALRRRLTPDGVRRYDTSVPASAVAVGDREGLHLGTQAAARALVRQLRLPDARMVVGFRAMEHAASVELTAGPEYVVELNERFARPAHRRDIGAALAHEITHVLLHRLGLSFPTTAQNEILTDVAAAYLGAGWLLLDAFRQDGTSSQRLGYLTPEEFGYVLAERARLFGEDPSPWFTSAVAYEAWVRGREEAARDRSREGAGVLALTDLRRSGDSGEGRRMSTLFEALWNGDDDGVVRALRDGADPEAREDGETALYRAAVGNQPVAVRLLLAAGADPGRRSGEDDGDLPLCGAACGGHAEVVRALLAAGADPDQEEGYGFTALAWALRLGHAEVVRELLEAGAAPDRPGPDGLAPLVAAARRGSASCVRALLEHGAGSRAEALDEARRWIGADMAAVLRRGLVEGGGAGDTYEAVVRRVPEDGGVTVVVELLREDGAPGRGDERQTGHAAIATLLEGALGIRVPHEELAARALRCGDPDQDDWTTAVAALTARPDETAFAAATAWCSSPDPLRRALGARVLGALPGFTTSAVPVLRGLAAEVAAGAGSAAAPGGAPPEPGPPGTAGAGAVARQGASGGGPAAPAAPGAREPALSVVVALGQCADGSAVPELLGLAGHQEGEVRRQVAASLAGIVPAGHGRALAALVELSGDHDARVRDWATLALAELPDDPPAVREALAARLTDPDPETAAEAARGLALRQDPRAVEALARILADGDPEGPARETALAALEHVREPRVRTRLEWTAPRCR